MDISEIIFLHQTPVQIRYNDIDIAGHVNNAVHLYYFDYGRMVYFNEVFGGLIQWREKGFVLVRITVDYHNPVFLGESIFVHSRIYKTGNKSIEMVQKVTDSNGMLKSTNVATLVCYDYIGKNSMELPTEWKEKIIEHRFSQGLKMS